MTPTGRFAPSPTGELHFGSLVAAVASCLNARSRGGQWLVRVEDIDPPREVPGSANRILREILDGLGERIHAGMSTMDIDRVADLQTAMFEAALAVEAVEGTDECIRRAGRLCPHPSFRPASRQRRIDE
mgnify:CR=1 FL=1